MTIDQVIKHFNTASEACKKIGVQRQAFTNWKARGFIPLRAQLKFEFITRGKLKADSHQQIEHYKNSQETNK